MNKREFLSALGKALPHRGKGLRSVLNFYGEMIDDLVEEGLGEAEAVERIGSVEGVCARILAESTPAAADGKGRSKAELVLLILGAPLWIVLLLAGLALALAFYATLWSLILALLAIELPFLLLSLVSKYLFPACRACFLGGLVLTRRGAALALGWLGKGADN